MKQIKVNQMGYKEIYPAIFDKFKSEDEKVNQVEIKSGMVLTFIAIIGAFLVFLYKDLPFFLSASILGLLLFASFSCILNLYPRNVSVHYFKKDKIEKFANKKDYQLFYKDVIDNLFETQEVFEKLAKWKFLRLQGAIEITIVAIFILAYSFFMYIFQNVYILVFILILLVSYLITLFNWKFGVIK